MQKTSEKILYKGQWLAIKQLELKTNNGQKIHWECIERNKTSDIIVIMAKIKQTNEYVLIKQFRPAINSMVYGLPAGLCDNQNMAVAALRELKEETGYVGQIIDISPSLAFNPALTNEKVYLVSMEIDQNQPTNTQPKQELEFTEEIEVVLVKSEKLEQFLKNELKKGELVSIALWYLFAINSKA